MNRHYLLYLLLFLFSCKKKDNFLPLRTGKYLIEYTKVHPDGTIEYSEYTAFGPKMADGKYGFDLKVTDSTGLCSALLSYNQKEFSYLYLIGCTSTGASHKINSYDVSDENLTIHYTSDPYADTISGTFIFKLIDE